MRQQKKQKWEINCHEPHREREEDCVQRAVASLRGVSVHPERANSNKQWHKATGATVSLRSSSTLNQARALHPRPLKLVSFQPHLRLSIPHRLLLLQPLRLMRRRPVVLRMQKDPEQASPQRLCRHWCTRTAE